MRRVKFAYTLVEVLVCASIAMILTSIAVTVYRQGLRGGKLGVEMEQMRQLGLAANLYHEQYDAWPDSTQTLVNANMFSRENCLSPRDRYEKGYANAYLKAIGRLGGQYEMIVAPFPNTYLCIGEIWMTQRDEMNKMLAEQGSPGLFVSLVDSDYRFHNDNPSGPFKGRYLRVLLDGSVVAREHLLFDGFDEDHNPIEAESPSALFFDPTEDWVRDFMKTMGKK